MLIHINADGIPERCRSIKKPCPYGGPVAQTSTRKRRGKSGEVAKNKTADNLPLMTTGANLRGVKKRDKMNDAIIDKPGNTVRKKRSYEDFKKAYRNLVNTACYKVYFITQGGIDWDEYVEMFESHDEDSGFTLTINDNKLTEDGPSLYQNIELNNFINVEIFGKGYADFTLPANNDGSEVFVMRGYVSPEELSDGSFLTDLDEILSRHTFEGMMNSGAIMREAANRFHAIQPAEWIYLAREFSDEKDKILSESE